MRKGLLIGTAAMVSAASCSGEAPAPQSTQAIRLPLPELGAVGPGEYRERAREGQILALLRAKHSDDAEYAQVPVQATITFTDLNGDGAEEALAYVEGWGPGGVCGTSGCDLYVYTPEGRDYRMIANLFGYPPVRALSSRSHGWRDLAMWVQGGGHVHGFEAAAAFNGRDYDGNNLGNPPAWRVPSGTAGDTLIPNKLTLSPGASPDGPPPPPFGPAR